MEYFHLQNLINILHKSFFLSLIYTSILVLSKTKLYKLKFLKANINLFTASPL